MFETVAVNLAHVRLKRQATHRRPRRLYTRQQSTVNKLLPLPQILHRRNADGPLAAFAQSSHDT